MTVTATCISEMLLLFHKFHFWVFYQIFLTYYCLCNLAISQNSIPLLRLVYAWYVLLMIWERRLERGLHYTSISILKLKPNSLFWETIWFTYKLVLSHPVFFWGLLAILSSNIFYLSSNSFTSIPILIIINSKKINSF